MPAAYARREFFDSSFLERGSTRFSESAIALCPWLSQTPARGKLWSTSTLLTRSPGVRSESIPFIPGMRVSGRVCVIHTHGYGEHAVTQIVHISAWLKLRRKRERHWGSSRLLVDCGVSTRTPGLVNFQIPWCWQSVRPSQLHHHQVDQHTAIVIGIVGLVTLERGRVGSETLDSERRKSIGYQP